MMYEWLLIFILGASLGSFYNVVGARLPLGKSISYPPSHCESCQHKLTPIELLPIISYIFLRGKCRKCGAKIGLLHPLIELCTAVLFVYAYYYFGLTLELLIAWVFISLLAIITVSDILYMLILDKILLVFGLFVLVLRFFSPLDPWWDMFAGANFGFGLLYILGLMNKGGIGGGDIKLYFVIGLVLGVKLTALSLFLSSLIALVVAVILKKSFGKMFPFGPSIAVGSLITYFYGEAILTYYFSLIL